MGNALSTMFKGQFFFYIALFFFFNQSLSSFTFQQFSLLVEEINVKFKA